MDVQNDKFTLECEGKKFYFCSLGDLERFKVDPKYFVGKYAYDLIIVGAGPAGLTAAVYASILNISTFLVTENIGGQPVDSSKIVNYMGFDFISGPELTKKFQDQLIHQHYIDHLIDKVSSIEKGDNLFSVSTSSGRKYQSYTLIIATGMQRRKLNVPGEEKLLRRGVSYVLSQDLSLFTGKTVAIVGGGNSALQGALELVKEKCGVIVVSLTPLTADPTTIEDVKRTPNLVILEECSVIEIEGENSVEDIVVRNLRTDEESRYQVNGVLIAIGQSPNSSLVEHLANLNERKEIVIAADCSTRTPGLFACGDVTNTLDKRIIIASGEGAKAALASRRYLLNLS